MYSIYDLIMEILTPSVDFAGSRDLRQSGSVSTSDINVYPPLLNINNQISIAAATQISPGIISAGIQAIGGEKTFHNRPKIASIPPASSADHIVTVSDVNSQIDTKLANLVQTPIDAIIDFYNYEVNQNERYISLTDTTYEDATIITGYIYQHNGNGWVGTAPSEGMVVYNRSNDKLYIYKVGVMDGDGWYQESQGSILEIPKTVYGYYAGDLSNTARAFLMRETADTYTLNQVVAYNDGVWKGITPTVGTIIYMSSTNSTLQYKLVDGLGVWSDIGMTIGALDTISTNKLLISNGSSFYASGTSFASMIPYNIIGSAVGTVVNPPVISGGAFLFAHNAIGSAQYITWNAGISLFPQFTARLKVKFNETIAALNIQSLEILKIRNSIDVDIGLSLFLDSVNDRYQVNMSPTVVSGMPPVEYTLGSGMSAKFSDLLWHEIELCTVGDYVDGTTGLHMYLYIDGILIDSYSSDSAEGLNDPTASYTVTLISTATENNMSIRELSIWNRALHTGENYTVIDSEQRDSLTRMDTRAQCSVIGGLSVTKNISCGSVASDASVSSRAGVCVAEDCVLYASWKQDVLPEFPPTNNTITGTGVIENGYLKGSTVNVALIDSPYEIDPGNIGTIEFDFVPSYSGIPSGQVYIIRLSSLGDSTIYIYHRPTTGNVNVGFTVSGTDRSLNTVQFLPNAGQLYKFSLGWNVLTGVYRLYINGALIYNHTYSAGLRPDSQLGEIQIGRTGSLNFYIGELVVYNTMRHTEASYNAFNYTPLSIKGQWIAEELKARVRTTLLGKTYAENMTANTFELTTTVTEDLQLIASVKSNSVNLALEPSTFDSSVLAWRFKEASSSPGTANVTCQMPHGWKFGTNVVPHVHWCATTANTGNIQWTITLVITAIGATGGFAYTDTQTYNIASSEFQKHNVTYFAPINMAAYTTPSVVLTGFVRRLRPASYYPDDCELLGLDIHYQTNKLGYTV